MSVEAVQLTPIQFDDLLVELEKIPTYRSPIPGEIAVLCFRFMEDTGSRVTETTHVKKQDINFKTKILTITQPKSEKKCKCSVWRYKNLYTRTRELLKSNPDCKLCHGKGKWKKPQRTTFTNRISDSLLSYCDTLNDEDYLFPISRQSLWRWGKKAGINAEIDIFQQKEERFIEGIFLHMFRAMCALRILKDAKLDNYKHELVSCKLRHSERIVTDRYTKIDINYLLSWEKNHYQQPKLKYQPNDTPVPTAAKP